MCWCKTVEISLGVVCRESCSSARTPGLSPMKRVGPSHAGRTSTAITASCNLPKTTRSCRKNRPGEWWRSPFPQSKRAMCLENDRLQLWVMIYLRCDLNKWWVHRRLTTSSSNKFNKFNRASYFFLLYQSNTHYFVLFIKKNWCGICLGGWNCMIGSMDAKPSLGPKGKQTELVVLGWALLTSPLTLVCVWWPRWPSLSSVVVVRHVVLISFCHDAKHHRRLVVILD